MEYPKPIMGATELRQMGFPDQSLIGRPDQKASGSAGEVTRRTRGVPCYSTQKDSKNGGSPKPGCWNWKCRRKEEGSESHENNL